MSARGWCLGAALLLVPTLSRAGGSVAMEPEIHTVGDTVVVEIRGPRPSRVSRTTTPDRLVLDFPGPAMDGYNYYPRTRSLEFTRVIALRRGQFDDEHGTHARLTLVLAKPLKYRMVWAQTAGTLYLVAGNRDEAPQFAGIQPPNEASRQSAPTTMKGASQDPGAPHAPRELRSRTPNAGDEEDAPSAAHPAAPAKPEPAGKAALREGSQRAERKPGKTAQPTLQLVASALKKGDIEAASNALDALTSIQPAENLAPLFAQLALRESESRRDPARVERHAREALVAGFEDVKLDLAMGRAIDRQMRPGEAGRWFRRATQIGTDPDRTDDSRRAAYFLWADALYRTGRPADEVLAAYEEAMEAYASAPETAWGLYQRSKLQLRMRHEGEARALLAELVGRFPDDHWTSQARARLGNLVAVQTGAVR